MSNENNTLDQGGGEALAAPQPRNDAEAQQQAQAATQEADQAKEVEAKKAEDEAAKRKNRTTQYIERLRGDSDAQRRENVELRKRLDALESRVPRQELKEPTLEDANFDPQELARQMARWEVQQARQQWEKEQQTDAANRTEQEKVAAYQGRVNAFTAENPDFFEVVGSMDTKLLHPELQKAIMAHEKGPQIAYQLALNDDDLFQLASVRPELLGTAVDRFASRLESAQATAVQEQPAALAPAPQPAQKPASQAPAPAPRLGGRTPTEIPPEKLTDDQWFAKRQEARRKR